MEVKQKLKKKDNFSDILVAAFGENISSKG